MSTFQTLISNRSRSKLRKDGTWPIVLVLLATWNALRRRRMVCGRSSKWPPGQRCRHAGAKKTTNAISFEHAALDSNPKQGCKMCVDAHSFLKLAKPFGRKNNCSENSFVLLILFFDSLISHGSVLSVFKESQRTWTFACFVFDVLPEFCDIKATPTCQMLSCD